jgi:tetratricopeptide (TPR) repeat protein
MERADPADIWAWIERDKERLEREGGAKRGIVSGWRMFWAYYHHDREAADLAITGALDTAKAEGEPRWELLLRHWRLQLWLNGDIRRALPEAVDLLSLATDERVRDVPQRICAFHDVVDCHVRMDPAGYYDDIVSNSAEVLAQLPARHQCADCARLHYATAAAASGRVQEAETWAARLAANLSTPDSTSTWGPSSLASVNELLGRWDDAEREYALLCEQARKRELSDDYLEGLIGLARARAGKGNTAGAMAALREAQHMAKYTGAGYELARLLEVEGYVAEATGEHQIALDYFARAARQYLALSRFRDAALAGLRAAELAREHGLEAAEALAAAARAAGQMPPASRDIFARLQALGQSPISASTDDPSWHRDASAVELAGLEDALAGHTASGELRGVALALYRIGRWHAGHKQLRAAVDYFIANAVLERILELPMNDREDALGALQRLRDELPAGTVEAALVAAEQGPSSLLAPLLGDMPMERWRWLVRAVADEVAGRTPIEPEPAEREGRAGFEAWLEHVASMAALIVRFRDRLDPARRDAWARSMDETVAEMRAMIGPNGEGREVVALAEALAALGRGAEPEGVLAGASESARGLVEQILAVAQEPVWRHPGSSPLDFLVERAAQRAVRALRLHDEHRAGRLANLAWRFDLMTIDLRQHEELLPIARFLDALGALLLAGGTRVPDTSPPLEDPFTSVLQAVYESGRLAPPAGEEPA